MSVAGHLILLCWSLIGWLGTIALTQRGLAPFAFAFPLVGFGLLHKLHGLSMVLMFRLGVLTAIGLFADVLLSVEGIISFSPALSAGLLPLWLVSMWLLHASLLPVLRSFFGDSPIMTAAAGLAIGPLGYLLVEPWGILKLDPAWGFALYGVFWAFYLPLCLRYLTEPSLGILRRRLEMSAGDQWGAQKETG